MSLEQIDKDYILHSYGKNYTNFTKGESAKIFDENGKDYIDFGSGIGVCSVGHGNKRLAKVICDQAQKMLHISNLWLIEPQAKLAQKIVELSGFDMRLFFANSGAEANEGALKIARKYGNKNFNNKKHKIVTLENSFHGRTITTVKATGQEKMHTEHFSPYPDGFIYAKDIDDIYNKIDSDTVAVMIELVQGEGGVEPLCKDKVQALSKQLKQQDILLIVDEVQTGVYRSGEFLASNYYEIEPDIITLAKGLGGGLPIGAVMTNLKDIFEPGDHGSTFGGNYLSTRGALEVVDILNEAYKSNQISENINKFNIHIEDIVNSLPELFEKSVGIGLMLGLRCKNNQIQSSIITEALSCGLLVLKAGRDTVRFLPPLTITEDEIEEGFKRLELTLSRIEVN